MGTDPVYHFFLRPLLISNRSHLAFGMVYVDFVNYHLDKVNVLSPRQGQRKGIQNVPQLLEGRPDSGLRSFRKPSFLYFIAIYGHKIIFHRNDAYSLFLIRCPFLLRSCSIPVFPLLVIRKDHKGGTPIPVAGNRIDFHRQIP